MKKYEFTGEVKTEDFIELKRIRLLIDIPGFQKGDLGGWIEEEYNLSHDGNCWITENAKVFRNAIIRDNAVIFDNSIISNGVEVHHNAIVSGNSIIKNYSTISGNAVVENSNVSGHVIIEHKLVNKTVKLIYSDHYFINYSGFDEKSGEHFVRVRCQIHSIKTWRNANFRKRIMEETNFPKCHENKFLKILDTLEKVYVRNNKDTLFEKISKFIVSKIKYIQEN